MSFAFEVIFVKIYSLAVLLFEREKKLVVRQDGRFFLMKGQKDLIRRRITQLSSFVIPFRLPNSSLLLY